MRQEPACTRIETVGTALRRELFARACRAIVPRYTASYIHAPEVWSVSDADNPKVAALALLRREARIGPIIVKVPFGGDEMFSTVELIAEDEGAFDEIVRRNHGLDGQLELMEQKPWIGRSYFRVHYGGEASAAVGISADTPVEAAGLFFSLRPTREAVFVSLGSSTEFFTTAQIVGAHPEWADLLSAPAERKLQVATLTRKTRLVGAVPADESAPFVVRLIAHKFLFILLAGVAGLVFLWLS